MIWYDVVSFTLETSTNSERAEINKVINKVIEILASPA